MVVFRRSQSKLRTPSLKHKPEETSPAQKDTMHLLWQIQSSNTWSSTTHLSSQKSLHHCKGHTQVIICHHAQLLRARNNRYRAYRSRKILSLISFSVETSSSTHRNRIQWRWNLPDGFLSDRKTTLLDQCFSTTDPGSNGWLWDIWDGPWNSCTEGWLVFWVGGGVEGIVFLVLYLQYTILTCKQESNQHEQK